MDGWGETVSGIDAADANLTVVDGDIYKLEGVLDAATDEYMYYTQTLGSLDSDTCTRYLFRWKTGVAANGLGARVRLGFDDATEQWLLGETIPQFSTTWQVESGTITPGKTITSLRLYADDYPNTLDAGTFQVYYDFALLHKGTFTFPSASDGIRPRFSNRYADIEIPGRVGDITQYLGAKSPEFVLSGNVKSDTGWGSPLLQYLYENHFNAHQEPWQWFTSDLFSGKVTIRDFNPFQIGQNSQRVWELTLKKFDGHCGSVEWIWDYFLGQGET